MKPTNLLSSLIMISALGLSLNAQTPDTAKQPAPGILGYLDAKTGAFHMLHQEAAGAEFASPNTANTTGKLVFNYTISIQSSIPTSVPLSCTSAAQVIETNATTGTYRNFYETAAVTATRSGNTATCTVVIPYSWALATASSDTVALTVTVTATATTAVPFVYRWSTQNLPSIKVPANGATTSGSVAVTI